MLRPLIAALLLAALPALADPVTVTAEVGYRERIALPSEAQLLAELRDGNGRLLAASAGPTGGAQVPLALRIEAPEAAEVMVLRTAILGPGAPWVSDPVVLPRGTGRIDAGAVTVRRVAPAGPAHGWRCGTDLFWLGWTANGARLRHGGLWTDLVPDRAASGARAVAAGDAGTFAWSKGGAMTISWRGRAHDCVPALDPLAAGFSARGNEPGWRLEIGGGRLRFGRVDAPLTEAPLPRPERVAGGLRYALPEAGLTITLADRLAHDSMAGLPYPVAVTVVTPEGVLTGTGGDPGALIEGLDWRLVELAGKPLAQGVAASLRFDGRGVLGHGGCNRYTGSFDLTGETLAIGPVAATMMACPGAQMAAERGLFAAFAATRSFDIGADGGLLLLRPGGPVARFLP